MIWSTDYLAQLDIDAGNQISTDLNCIYNRKCFAVQTGKSVYTLPEKLRSLLRITWRGYKLEPINWEDFTLLSPTSVYLDNTNKIEVSNSRPYYYTIHPTNLFDIRFFPTPNETFTAIGDAFSPDRGPKCIISYYQLIDTSAAITSLPAYINRRTRKAYVLWQAFIAEGPGQNLRAGEYYRAKYQYLISRFRAINSGCYISKKYVLGDAISTLENYRYPRPVLPSNFPRS